MLVTGLPPTVTRAQLYEAMEVYGPIAVKKNGRWRIELLASQEDPKAVDAAMVQFEQVQHAILSKTLYLNAPNHVLETKKIV